MVAGWLGAVRWMRSGCGGACLLTNGATLSSTACQHNNASHTTPVSCLQVAEEDLQRVAEASGGQIQTTVNKLSPKALGTCALFEERQVGAERYNLFKGAWAGEGGRCCGSERGSSV